jgi:hypothetical protein
MRTIFAETRSGRWISIPDLGLKGDKLWRRIDGCRLRYRKAPVRFLRDDSYWSLLATYVLGDGDLTKHSQVRFYDNERATLTTISDMFSKRFGYSFPKPVYEENQYGRGQWVTRTRHAALHFVLTEYFGIPVGRKKRTSTLSDRIVISRKAEVKYAALAGMFSSDGYVNCNRAGGRFSVRICLLTAVSERKILRVASLLRNLGYHPYISTSRFRNPLNGREITSYGVVVHRHTEVIRLFFQICPYLLKPFRTQQLMRFVMDERFFKRVRLHSPEAHSILREAAMKTAGSSYRCLHVLAELAHKYGVKHWTNTRGDYSAPFPVLAECCEVLGKDIVQCVPVELAPLLWLQGRISYKRFVALRRIEPLLHLDSMLRTNHNHLQNLRVLRS